MWPDQVSIPGPLALESDVLPSATHPGKYSQAYISGCGNWSLWSGRESRGRYGSGCSTSG